MAFPVWVLGVILAITGKICDNFGNNLVCWSHKEAKMIAKEKSSKSRSSKSIKSNSSSPPISPQPSQVLSTVCDDNEAAVLVGPDSEPSGLSIDTDFPSEETETVQYEIMGCNIRFIGITIFAIGNLLVFASFGFGAQSLLASMGSVQFLSNICFVKYVHRLRITTRMVIATILIILGNVMVVIFSEHSAVLFTSDQMMRLYRENHVYHGYMVFAILLWASTTGIYMHYHNARMIDRKLLWEHTFIEPFCYAVSSAVIGTQAVLKAKCIALLINVTADGQKNEFLGFYFYFVFGIWLILVTYWLKRLDGGLKMYPPPFIIPVLQVFFVFFAVMCGGLYFQEFVHFSTAQFIGFGIGVTMILSGVYGLAPTDVQLEVGEEDEDEEESAQVVEKSKLAVYSDIDEESMIDGTVSIKPSLPLDGPSGKAQVVPIDAEEKISEE